MTVNDVFNHTKIDKWFLSKLYNVHTLSQKLKSKELRSLTAGELQTLKCCGFSDNHIAHYLKNSKSVGELDVRRARIAKGVKPVVKQIDTLAAEFPAQTNYLYVTYNGSEHDMATSSNGVMVLGCGAYVVFEFNLIYFSCSLEKINHIAQIIRLSLEVLIYEYVTLKIYDDN